MVETAVQEKLMNLGETQDMKIYILIGKKFLWEMTELSHNLN